MRRRSLLQVVVIFACAGVLPGVLWAQTGAAELSTSQAREQIAEGNRATTLRQPRVALEHYELALQPEPRNYEALWKASTAAVDLGEAEPDEKKRDAFYAKGTALARRAADVNADGADGQFSVARALGRTALSLGARDRVKYGTEVREHALKALSLNPKHAGALHVMGMWNAEIMRLNSIARLFAKTLLGGQVFGTASWAAAVSYIDQAVAADPVRAVHRLDQARIYRDTGRKADARAAYEAALQCSLIDSNDEMYLRAATAELRALK